MKHNNRVYAMKTLSKYDLVSPHSLSLGAASEGKIDNPKICSSHSLPPLYMLTFDL